MEQQSKLIKLTVNQHEAVDIFNILGQLPTQSNAHPLWVKVGTQIKNQVEDESILDSKESEQVEDSICEDCPEEEN